MSTALAVSPRHLALPESCLFAPTELSIPAAISKEDFKQLGAALCAIDTADGLWQADFALYAIRRWAAEGLNLASAATNLTARYLKNCARVAEVFAPEHRRKNINLLMYMRLLSFSEQPELHTWLASIATLPHLSCRKIYILACAKWGK